MYLIFQSQCGAQRDGLWKVKKGAFAIEITAMENISAIRQRVRHGTLPRAQGIKIIITLEIGHGRGGGGGGTLVIFGGHMPVSAGTKPDECKKWSRA